MTKSVRISDDIHAKLENIMQSYNITTFGQAINYAINKLFLDEGESESVMVTVDTDLAVLETTAKLLDDQVKHYRKLELTRAKNPPPVSGGGYVSIPNMEKEQGKLDSYMEYSSDDYDEYDTLSDSEIQLLRDTTKDGFEKSQQELDDLYKKTNGKILKPSQVAEVSNPDMVKDDGLETFDEYQARTLAHKKALADGTEKPIKCNDGGLLELRAKNSLNESLPPNLKPPPI